MTREEILAGESKNVEFKVSRPEKSIKYMKSVVAFANGKGGLFLELIMTPERLSVSRRKAFSARWMRLQMQFLIAVSQLSFRMFILRRLTGKLSLSPKSAQEGRNLTTLSRMGLPMGFICECQGLPEKRTGQ